MVYTSQKKQGRGLLKERSSQVTRVNFAKLPAWASAGSQSITIDKDFVCGCILISRQNKENFESVSPSSRILKKNLIEQIE